MTILVMYIYVYHFINRLEVIRYSYFYGKNIWACLMIWLSFDICLFEIILFLARLRIEDLFIFMLKIYSSIFRFYDYLFFLLYYFLNKRPHQLIKAIRIFFQRLSESFIYFCFHYLFFYFLTCRKCEVLLDG